jgi:hypothetical protein
MQTSKLTFLDARVKGSHELSVGDIRGHTQLLSRIYSVFGLRTVLIPASEPMPTCEPAPRFEYTLKATYQRELWNSDIAVLTGIASDGLRVVRFRELAAVKEFLGLNTCLAAAPVTHSPAGHWIWFRTTGWCPQAVATQRSSFFPGGYAVKVFSRREHKNYTIQPDRYVVPVLNWHDLKWPTEIGTRFTEAEIEESFGPPVEHGAINVRYWATLMTRLLEIKYLPQTGSFQTRGGHAGEFTRQEFRDLVSTVLSKSKMSHGSMPGLTASVVNAIVDEIIHATTALKRTAPELLSVFVRAIVVPAPGKDLTSEEIYLAYRKFCLREDCLPMTKEVFEKRLPRLMDEYHFKHKAHRIPRLNPSKGRWTQRRGYLNVAVGFGDAQGREGTGTE